MSNTTTPRKISLGQIEAIAIEDVAGLQAALTNSNPQGNPYVHPTQAVINTGLLSGVEVISRIQVNTLGHVELISTRSISAATIGAQPLGNYEVMGNKSNSNALGTSTSLYPTQGAVKNYVDTNISTLTNRAINTSTGLQGGGNLSADRSLSVTANVFMGDREQVNTSLHETRIVGASTNVNGAIAKRYSIGVDSLYKLDLVNTQNLQAATEEIQWHYKYTYNVGVGVAKSMAMIGMARGGVTVIGGSQLPTAIYTDAATLDETNRLTPSYRYPLRLYAYATTQLESAIIGSNALLNDKITADTRLYLDGSLRTKAPDGGTEASILFGTDSASVSNTVDTVWKVKVGNKILEILARDITE